LQQYFLLDASTHVDVHVVHSVDISDKMIIHVTQLTGSCLMSMHSTSDIVLNKAPQV